MVWFWLFTKGRNFNGRLESDNTKKKRISEAEIGYKEAPGREENWAANAWWSWSSGPRRQG